MRRQRRCGDRYGEQESTFQYWDTILNMELLGLIFARAHRQQDFPLYVESMKTLVPWFFALVVDPNTYPGHGEPTSTNSQRVFGARPLGGSQNNK